LEKGLNMEINENCVKQVKKLLEDFFEYETTEEEVKTFMYFVRIQKFMVFSYLVYNKIWRDVKKYKDLVKLSRILNKYYSVETEKLYDKVETLIAYYHEDYDTLADKITDLLS